MDAQISKIEIRRKGDNEVEGEIEFMLQSQVSFTDVSLKGLEILRQS